MVDSRFFDAWLRLASEAARGSAAAGEAIRGPATGGASADFAAQLAKLTSPGTGYSQAAVDEWLQDWWRTLGVVPRYRYLELLDKYETLRTRLEEAESNVRKLRAMLGTKGVEQEAGKLLDNWASSVERTLEAQSAWLSSWAPAESDKKDRAGSSERKGTDVFEQQSEKEPRA